MATNNANNAINAPLPLVASQGGTGLATLTNHGVMLGAATGNIDFAGPSASSNSILMGQGASSDPAFLTNGTPYVTGISFDSGTTTLSKYATNTFVPAISIGGSTTGITYSNQTGKYYQIGGIVFCTIYIKLSSKGSQTGNVLITGLPVTASSTASTIQWWNTLSISELTLGGVFTGVAAQPSASSTNAVVYKYSPVTSSTVTTITNTELTNTSFMTGVIIYPISP